MRPIIEGNEIVGIACNDVLFTMEDIYRCPTLHSVYHQFMKEKDERDNIKET